MDAATYQRQRDKLEKDLAAAEATSQATVVEQVDVEGVLGFYEAC
jgi:hypothetical protein